MGSVRESVGQNLPRDYQDSRRSMQSFTSQSVSAPSEGGKSHSYRPRQSDRASSRGDETPRTPRSHRTNDVRSRTHSGNHERNRTPSVTSSVSKTSRVKSWVDQNSVPQDAADGQSLPPGEEDYERPTSDLPPVDSMSSAHDDVSISRRDQHESSSSHSRPHHRRRRRVTQKETSTETNFSLDIVKSDGIFGRKLVAKVNKTQTESRVTDVVRQPKRRT